MRTLILRTMAASVALTLIASESRADAISGYTSTDLGAISISDTTGYWNVQLSSTGANGTLTTQDGTVYAFPRTDNLVANPQSLLATFPPLTNAPNAGPSNANSVFSFLDPSHVFLNEAGQFVATDQIGVAGHILAAETIVDTATMQPNGKFSPLMPLWSSTNNENIPGGQIAQAFDLNNAGQILGGTDPVSNAYWARDFFVYNLNTGLKTEIAALLPTGWYSPIPVALDDQGRILVVAESNSPPYSQNELFLLTPDGLSSNPIPAPEPTTLVTLAVAGLGLAARRWWKAK